jgi:FtsH-binding integral membrane protein
MTNLTYPGLLKRYWRGLSQTGAWLVGIISVFAFPPPEEVGSDSEQTFRAFCVFILAVLLGILAIPLTKYKGKKGALGWAVTAGIALLAGGVLFFEYQNQRAEYSAKYEQKRIVVGSILTSAGQMYATHEAGFTKEKAVFDAGGKPALIWQSASIHKNANRLHTTYTFVVVFLALSAVLAIQAKYCASQKR